MASAFLKFFDWWSLFLFTLVYCLLSVQQSESTKPMTNFQSNAKGRQKGTKNLEFWQREFLNDWLKQNEHNVYPSENEKLKIARALGIEKKKISNWFINVRKRYYQGDEMVQINKYRYKPKLQLKKREDAQKLIDQEIEVSNDVTSFKICEDFKSLQDYCMCDAMGDNADQYYQEVNAFQLIKSCEAQQDYCICDSQILPINYYVNNSCSKGFKSQILNYNCFY